MSQFEIQAELIANNFRYADVFWETFLKEQAKYPQVSPSGLAPHMRNVAVAYAKISAISDEVRACMEAGKPASEIKSGKRGVAKAFWLTNVSWLRAFFADIINWADRNLPSSGPPWLYVVNSGGSKGFDSAHYAIPRYLNGGGDIKVPPQEPSYYANPVLMDLIDDMRWSELMRKEVLWFAPLAIIDRDLRKGDRSYRNHIKPLIERFVKDGRRPHEMIVGLTFARADLVFYEGLFKIFIDRKLFTDDLSTLVTAFLKDYREELAKFSP